MFLQRGSRAVRTQWHVSKSMARLAAARAAGVYPSRRFHDTAHLRMVKPVLLADIGEGIVECEIIQWFVEPGARVEEFSPLCEVQSDKASVEITSRFSGVVKKLHYDAGDMAKVGKPFVDIDIQGGAKQEDLDALTAPTEPAGQKQPAPGTEEPPKQQQDHREQSYQQAREATPSEASTAETQSGEAAPRQRGKHAALATPAVRHLSKALNVDIVEIDGTGKDGRVLKEDVQNFVKRRESGNLAGTQRQAAPPSGAEPTPGPATSGPQVETRVPLTVTQQQMFKSMTRSLNIPHFLYADEVDFSSLVQLRTRLNRVLASTPELGGADGVAKLSYLPFIIKAVSMALYQYPILNARVDLDPSAQPPSKPSLVMRSQHNIGVAMDTPSGLLVPVIRNVGSLNILTIAKELTRLQKAAFAGKLTPQDLSGGTITVSNIGNIGGTYLSPVIVDKEVAILGIGRMRAVPAFESEDTERVVRKHVTNFSWSADHRVVDGATMARAAEVVRNVVEEPDVMVMHLR